MIKVQINLNDYNDCGECTFFVPSKGFESWHCVLDLTIPQDTEVPSDKCPAMQYESGEYEITFNKVVKV